MHSFLWVLEIQTQILVITEQEILPNKLFPSTRLAHLFVDHMMARLKILKQAQASYYPASNVWCPT